MIRIVSPIRTLITEGTHMKRSQVAERHHTDVAERLKTYRVSVLRTPSSLGQEARSEVAGAMNLLLADFFALYVKTKNFHWHVSGPHFRDYHLLLDEQAAQIFATTEAIAERARKLGGTTLRSIGHIL